MLQQEHKLARTAVQGTGGRAEYPVVFLEEPLAHEWMCWVQVLGNMLVSLHSRISDTYFIWLITVLYFYTK